MMKGLSNQKQKGFEDYVVSEELPLLEWLLKNIKSESRTKIKAILKGKGIKVNGKIVTRYDFPLTQNMIVSVSKKKPKKVFKSHYLNIVYEDRFLIVIEKKEGILSMAAGASLFNVKALLDDYFRNSHQKCTAHVVHRLDRDTSGLMIYAKDVKVAQILEMEWHDLVYDRRYVAVLSGELKENAGTIDNWLKDSKSYFTYSSPYDNGGKYAVTHFKVLNRTIFYSLVEYKLETGRKNQIRVHSADIGYPVCGDVKYGNGDDPLNRLCLHAYILRFIHPITHVRLEFETPIPKKFLQLFK